MCIRIHGMPNKWKAGKVTQLNNNDLYVLFGLKNAEHKHSAIE